VVEAVKKQVDSYLHLMVYGEMIQSPQVRYAERLAELLPANLMYAILSTRAVKQLKEHLSWQRDLQKEQDHLLR